MVSRVISFDMFSLNACIFCAILSDIIPHKGQDYDRFCRSLNKPEHHKASGYLARGIKTTGKFILTISKLHILVNNTEGKHCRLMTVMLSFQ